MNRLVNYLNGWVLASIWVVPSAFAQTTIQGKLPEPNQTVILVKFSDALSRTEVIWEATSTDEEGYFSFSIDLEAQVFAGLRVGTTRQDLWFLPDNKYVFGWQENDLVLEEESPYALNRNYAKFSREHSVKGYLMGLFRGEKGKTKVWNRSRDRAWKKWMGDIPQQYLEPFHFENLASMQSFGVEGYSDAEVYQAIEDTVLNVTTVVPENPYYWRLWYDYMHGRINRGSLHRSAYSWPYVAHETGFTEAAFFSDPEKRELAKVITVIICFESEWFGVGGDGPDVLLKVADSLYSTLNFSVTRNLLARHLTQWTQMMPGDDFPQLALNTLDGVPFDWSTLEGKYVLVDFWASWCTSCIQHMRHFDELYQAYPDDFEVLSISVDREPVRSKRIVNAMGFDWNMIYNGPSGNYYSEVMISGYPTYYILDREGKVLTLPTMYFNPKDDLPKILADEGVESAQ
ncbi:MAG TPA: hypothetical protein DCE41_28335 [Cytophagales bacterium]|nr:hypothetical protein [Cytophagales bacterium]HAA18420.1 hypothetical protein [Cytophagales bacterium]HAP61467.1 hypothetical protein [Cytophagales bacterium]